MKSLLYALLFSLASVSGAAAEAEPAAGEGAAEPFSVHGALTGAFQQPLSAPGRETAEAVGRAEIQAKAVVADWTVVLDVEGTRGGGPDRHVPSLSGLNDLGGDTPGYVQVRRAWAERSFLDGILTVAAGKLDFSYDFDLNAVANEAASQFLSSAFVNSATAGFPTGGPGIRAAFAPSRAFTLSGGWVSGDGETGGLDQGFGIVEADFRSKAGEREGNYRVYGTVDGVRRGDGKLRGKTAFGIGLNVDQQVGGGVTLFGRWGIREQHVYEIRHAWSAGFQVEGLLSARSSDTLAFAYGQIVSHAGTKPEKLAEIYYKARLGENLSISPVAQYLINPGGVSGRDDALVLGARGQLSF